MYKKTHKDSSLYSKLWVVMTVVLTFIFVYCFFNVDVIGRNRDVKDCIVENKIMEQGMPNITVLEKEEVVEVEKVVDKIIEKEVKVYDFPFEVEELGTMTVKGCHSKNLPTKVYPKMKATEHVTAFASQDVLPEGTLIYIKDVGIRQVQSLQDHFDGICIYFNEVEDADNFGEQTLEIFEVLE